MNIKRKALNDLREAYSILLLKADALMRICEEENKHEPIVLDSQYIDTILDVTAAAFGLTTEKLISRRRPDELVIPRWIAMFLCREVLNCTFEAIASAFSKKDHTTVIYACSELQVRMQGDQVLATRVKTVRTMVECALNINKAA